MQTIVQTNNYVLQKMQVQPDFQKSDNVLTIVKPSYFLSNNMKIKEAAYLKITHKFQYQCTGCEKSVKKLYSGFCYPCLNGKPEADLCMVSPNRCHYAQGTCRSVEFAKSVCYQPHYLYLSFTDKYKIGLTRYSQIPTRWIDQGATLASPLLKTYSRHQAGVLEKLLSQHLSDKSHWQKMIKIQNTHPSLEEFISKWTAVKEWLLAHEVWRAEEWLIRPPDNMTIQNETNILQNPEVYQIIYPISDNIPDKFQSLKLETTNYIEGLVTGIKGQYVIFDHGRVLNVRNHSGFVIDIEMMEK